MAEESDRERVRRQHLDAYNVGTAALVLEDTSLAATPKLEPIIKQLRELWRQLESTKSA